MICSIVYGELSLQFDTQVTLDTFFKETGIELLPFIRVRREPETGMGFVWVPGGSYEVGCGPWDGEEEDDEKAVHEVRVDGFWIGKFPVTQGQWEKAMRNNRSHFKMEDDYPVERVSRNDTGDFIKKMNALHEGKYFFRLPTEAEWEYAYRSGAK